MKIKDGNTNKFVKQHRDQNLQRKAIYIILDQYMQILNIYKIFTPSTQCRCFCVQDNHQYALPKALMYIVNIPVLLTDGLYLATGIRFINHKRTLYLFNTYVGTRNCKQLSFNL